MVIEMGMKRRNDNFVMFMLKVGEFFGEKARVMVINQGYGSHDRRLRRHYGGAYQPVPYQVSERLGSIVVAFFSDEPIETVQ
jgi:hypothetical protein